MWNMWGHCSDVPFKKMTYARAIVTAFSGRKVKQRMYVSLFQGRVNAKRANALFLKKPDLKFRLKFVLVCSRLKTENIHRSFFLLSSKSY